MVRIPKMVAGDYGNYGPFYDQKMAWHSAGTYRIGDGRGAQDEMQTICPLKHCLIMPEFG